MGGVGFFLVFVVLVFFGVCLARVLTVYGYRRFMIRLVGVGVSSERGMMLFL